MGKIVEKSREKTGENIEEREKDKKAKNLGKSREKMTK